MQSSKKSETVNKLVAIQGEGKLGELIERLSYAWREMSDYDPLTYTHAELDAGDIGRAAGRLVGINIDEATEIALEAIAPSRKRQLGVELIEEMYSGLFGPQPESTPADAPAKERAW